MYICTYIYVCICMLIHTCIQIHSYTYMCTHTHIYIHTHAHTQTHTYTRKPGNNSNKCRREELAKILKSQLYSNSVQPYSRLVRKPTFANILKNTNKEQTDESICKNSQIQICIHF